MPSALFLSPHLDDVAFSCGGTVAKLRAEGWRVLVATAFTKSVPNPKGFALACQLDKGLAAGVDYMGVRRREDREWAEAAGRPDLRWMPNPEAPHRGYKSASELFAGIRPRDFVASHVMAEIGLLHDISPFDVFFAPQGLGSHVDHLQVIRAVYLTGEIHSRTVWYRDTPYAIRDPSARPNQMVGTGRGEFTIDISDHLAAKLTGAGCYGTQLDFQFGGGAAMREKLTAFALSEGGGTPAERFLGNRPAGL